MALPENGNQLSYLSFWLWYQKAFPSVCVVTLTCHPFKGLGPHTRPTRVFPAIQTQPWQRRKRQGGTSFHWETSWDTGELCMRFSWVHWEEGTGHQEISHPSPQLELFRPFSFQWNEKKFFHEEADSLLRVQVRIFWAVSGPILVPWIWAHTKEHPLQLSHCPTSSYFNSNARLMRKRLIRLCFSHITGVQEIILLIVRYWGVLSIFAFYNCFSKELGKWDFSVGAVITHPVTWEKWQNNNEVPPSSLSRLFTLSLFIAHLQIKSQNEWLEGADIQGRGKFAQQHSRLGAKKAPWKHVRELSLKARGLQLYISVIKSRLQPIILWNSDWAVQSAGVEGLEEESWKMPFFSPDPLLMLMGIMEIYYLISWMGVV